MSIVSLIRWWIFSFAPRRPVTVVIIPLLRAATPRMRVSHDEAKDPELSRKFPWASPNGCSETGETRRWLIGLHLTLLGQSIARGFGKRCECCSDHPVAISS